MKGTLIERRGLEESRNVEDTFGNFRFARPGRSENLVDHNLGVSSFDQSSLRTVAAGFAESRSVEIFVVPSNVRDRLHK